MKKDLYLKLLFIPTILLMLLVSIVYINDGKKVIVPNFNNKDLSEVIDWCSNLNSKYACIYKYEASKDVAINKVIAQSVKAEEKLTDKITFTISNKLLEPITVPSLNNLTKKDIELWVTKNNLLNVNFIEEESDTVDINQVIRIEPMDNIFPDTTINVYISKSALKKEIEVKAGDYLNLSESAFISKAKELGLVAQHLTDKDDYSDSIAKDNIVWHGSGSYELNEKISYGLSKGINTDGIYVKADAYLDYSEEKIISKAEELGLKPNHNTDRDAYSDDIEKGNVVWHGSGNYEKNETFNYGLSLGKKEGGESSEDTSSDTIRVNSGDFVNISVEEFESKTKALKLSPRHDSSVDAYSDNIEEGKIVWHGSGNYVENESIRYGLSLGKKKEDEKPQEENIALSSYTDIAAIVLATEKKKKASENSKSYLAKQGFTNYDITYAKSKNNGAGVLLKITVDGENHTSRKEYPKSANIVFTICSGYEEG